MRRTKRVKIYGIFVDDECRYVGASWTPIARARQLTKRRSLATGELRILEFAPPSTAGAVEIRWMKRMLLDGHRLENKKFAPWNRYHRVGVNLQP